jgi:peroxiredoxin
MTASIASRIPQQKASRIKDGGMVPLFYLPAVGGGQSGPASLRSKYNMVLVFVESGAAGEAYLAALAAAYPDIQANQAKALAVVARSLEDATELSARLKLHYILLADEVGATTSRVLGDGNHAALCVADRYGQAYHVAMAPTTAALPSIQAALDWLDFIQIQCPE